MASPRHDDAPDGRTSLRPLSRRAVWIGGVGLVAVAVGAALLLLLLGVGTTQLDAIRTAGTLVVGTGGGIALWLAARRQRSTEQAHQLAAQVALVNERDAEERRITELYGQAADQLGSDKAPVRLAGLHALERLAQSYPALRQTIVDVICAYLRMPYNRVDPSAEESDEHRESRQEREVRITAQRILRSHLISALDGFWECIRIDLTGAVLLDMNFCDCTVRIGNFGNAKLYGTSDFSSTTFEDGAYFAGAEFHDYAIFSHSSIGNNPSFKGAIFKGPVTFYGTKFQGLTSFTKCHFFSYANFGGCEFLGISKFDECVVEHDIIFKSTHFHDSPLLCSKFPGTVELSGATFERHPYVKGAIFERGLPLELQPFDAENKHNRLG